MKKGQIISNIIVMVFMAVSATLIVYSLAVSKNVREHTSYVIASVSNLLALICGIIYLAFGSTKKAGIWFKCFEVLVGSSILAVVFRSAVLGDKTIGILMATVSFGVLCILCVTPNLGKKRSYCLGAILAAIALASTITAFIPPVRFPRVVNEIAQLIINLVLVLLLTQKYNDKDSRGTV